MTRMESSIPVNVETMNLSNENKKKDKLEASHTDRLSDTAKVVREVSKKIGKRRQTDTETVAALI